MDLVINDYGLYLGTKGQNFVLYENKKLIKEIPFHKLNQLILGSGNCISTTALSWASMYGVNVVIVGKTGKPLSMMMPLSIDKRVKTRLKQYEAYKNHKGVVIAKEILRTRIQSQHSLTDKYNLDASRIKVQTIDRIDVHNKTIDQLRSRFTGIEGKNSEQYFKQYWKLFPKYLKPKKREKYKAVTHLNNLLNLGYEILKGEVYKAVLGAHLDPYLGYLHSIQYSKPSLVCDIQEMFRVLIEDFMISYALTLEPESFEQYGKRIFLKSQEKLSLIIELTKLLQKKISYNRKQHSKSTTIRTAIKEEAIKLAQFIKTDKASYKPVILSSF